MKRNHEVGKYLKAVLDDARENNWNDFTGLVLTLADLEHQGFSLSNRQSRAGHTYPLKIQDRILTLKPEFLEELSEDVKGLTKPYQGLRENIAEDFETIQSFNKHSMYAPKKSNKINLEHFKDLAFHYGLHIPLKNFQDDNNNVDALKTAKANAFLSGRNFEKEVQKRLGITRNDLYNSILFSYHIRECK